jgi:hypothetical protein
MPIIGNNGGGLKPLLSSLKHINLKKPIPDIVAH